MKQQPLSRRAFLKSAGAGAASVVLAACGGSATTTDTPTVAPTTAAEATTAPTTAAEATAAPTTAAEATAAPTTAAEATAAPTTAAEATASPPVSLSWATWVVAPVDNDNLVKQMLKERLNVDVQMLAFERATWADQINTRVAGGDIPDIIYRQGRNEVTAFVEQGILAEVPYDLIKQHAPRTFAAANDFTTDVWLATTYNGKNYGIPLLQPSQRYPFTNAWRKDWLDKVGITKVPETLDEHEVAFTSFVKNDPDGNGAADTYALSGRGKDIPTWAFVPFYTAFGTVPHMWMRTSENEVQWGGVMDGTRQALELLHRWYEQGLIDPEFVTVDANAMTQKWANGQIGFLHSTWYRLIPGGEHYDALKAVNPDAEIAMGWAPKGPDGQFGYFNFGPITSSITFGKQLEGSDKLVRALQLVEEIMTDEQLATFVRYGEEGEHWERDPETGAILFKPPYDEPQNRGALGVSFFAAMPPSPEVQSFHARKDEAELYAKAEAGNVDNFVPYLGGFIPPDVYAQAPDAATIQATWTLDFITGAKPIDQWDTYVQEWNDAGGKVLTDAANEAMKNVQGELQRIKDAVTN